MEVEEKFTSQRYFNEKFYHGIKNIGSVTRFHNVKI